MQELNDPIVYHLQLHFKQNTTELLETKIERRRISQLDRIQCTDPPGYPSGSVAQVTHHRTRSLSSKFSSINDSILKQCATLNSGNSRDGYKPNMTKRVVGLGILTSNVALVFFLPTATTLAGISFIFDYPPHLFASRYIRVSTQTHLNE